MRDCGDIAKNSGDVSMEKTLIAYYIANYGPESLVPTILIDVQSMGWLTLLRDSIRNLLDDAITEIDFLQFEDIEVSNIRTFQLMKSAKYAFAKVKVEEGILDLVWTLDADGLAHILYLMEPFFKAGGRGHQYIDVDDSLEIELGYKELYIRKNFR